MADRIDEDARRFGLRLQSYREQAKVTQQEIAQAAGLKTEYDFCKADGLSVLSLCLRIGKKKAPDSVFH